MRYNRIGDNARIATIHKIIRASKQDTSSYRELRALKIVLLIVLFQIILLM